MIGGMATQTTPPDLMALVETLDPDEIRRELDDLDRRSRALRVLLRSAVARQRSARDRDTSGRREVSE
jgi:hypothetical protein